MSREEKKLATRADLTRVARRLAAERGLGGFTVDELCDEVGVSRRTFFNYFGGKEEAVFGHHPGFVDGESAEEFVAAGDPSADEVSSDLVPDLVRLACRHLESMRTTPEETAHLFAAVRREPRLFERFASVGEERHRTLVDLIARREGLDPSDPRAHAAVHLLDALVHWSGRRYIAPGNTVPFEELLEQSLDAALHVLPVSPRAV